MEQEEGTALTCFYFAEERPSSFSNGGFVLGLGLLLVRSISEIQERTVNRTAECNHRFTPPELGSAFFFFRRASLSLEILFIPDLQGRNAIYELNFLELTDHDMT